MILSKPKVFILETNESLLEKFKIAEVAGRICYDSLDKITTDSYKKFLGTIAKSGHFSVLEHINISVVFHTNRGVSHQLVRHRHSSYSQQSTRFCKYSEDSKFGGVHYVISGDMDKNIEKILIESFKRNENDYNMLLAETNADQARSILPNSTKTIITMTTNLTEWIHVFRERAINPAAHKDIRIIMIPLMLKFIEQMPFIFSNIKGFEDEIIDDCKKHSKIESSMMTSDMYVKKHYDNLDDIDY